MQGIVVNDTMKIKVGDKVNFKWLGTEGTGTVKRVNKADIMVQPINHPTLKIPVRVWNFEKI